MHWAICTWNKNGKRANEEVSIIKTYYQQTHLSQKYILQEVRQSSIEQLQRKQWLEMGSVVHKKLVKIISEKTVVVNLEHITKQVNIILLEIFHPKQIFYLPKRRFFPNGDGCRNTNSSTRS